MLSRRGFIKLGGLGLVGLSLPEFLRAQAESGGPRRSRAKSWEFGRTPKVGQITSSAGADRGGRDHWPDCYTVLLGGAGIRRGVVYGASDRYAAYPADSPVTPEDIAATIYRALGLEPHTEIHDHLDRPLPITTGKPIGEILLS